MKHEPEQAWLLAFLRGIRHRPGMYLGHENVRMLWQYLTGYKQSRINLGLSPFGTGEPDYLQGFTMWLRERHGHGRSTIGWYDAIEELDGSDRNVSTFFGEFEAYLRSIGIDFDAIEPRPPVTQPLP